MANFILEDLKKLFRGKSNLVIFIILNTLVYLSFLIIDIVGEKYFNVTPGYYLYLHADLTELLPRFWTPVTYMFMHSPTSIYHLLFNMLILYFFGRILLENLGQKRFTALYLSGGLASAVFFLLCYNLSTLFGSDFLPLNTVLFGASGAVLAVVIAAARLYPNLKMNLFVLGQIPLGYLALAVFISSTLMELNNNTGGKIAHLGGAIWGYAYVLYLQKGKDIAAWVTPILDWFAPLFRKNSPLRTAHSQKAAPSKSTNPKPSSPNSNRDQQKTDIILDKISKSGYNSLTKEEKDFLFRQKS